jgi:DNA-binding NarL/FixJ family response regulator
LGQVSDLSTIGKNHQQHFALKLVTPKGIKVLASSIENKESTLTNQEIRILKEMASGLTSKSIGAKLHISHHTVETHRKNIVRKLEAENTQQALSKAFTMGLL